MAASSRRTVISGIGTLNALGLSTQAVWEGFLSGRSGVKPITLFDTAGLPVRIAGELSEFKARDLVDREVRKSLKMMARTIEFAVVAAQLALNDGNVDKNKLDRTRFGVEFGSGLIAMELPEVAEASVISTASGSVDMAKWGKEGLSVIQPLWMLKYLPNMLACHVSILHDAQGPNNTITESDVASLLALGEAYRILTRDLADFFLVGGAESKINPLSLVRQCLFEPISRHNDEPERACRPFDAARDGLVLGEGGTVLVVEDLAHAQQRGARIYAEVVGFGAAFDRNKDGKGLARAIRAALDDADISPEHLDHVNAHGLSTVESDRWEARGLSSVFGTSVPVFAPKSYLGNQGSGAGVSELAISILALHHGKLPPTLNYENPDPQCPVQVHTGGLRAVRKPYALKVGFTQMGQCGAVVIRKWDE